MEKLTKDGGIVKFILNPALDSALLPEWNKGTNALVHYKVSTAPFRLMSQNPQAHSLCNHIHSSNMEHEKSNDLMECESSNQVFTSLSGLKFVFDPTAKKKIVDSEERDGKSEYFEMRIGLSFTFKAFEQAVKSMKVGETSRFLITPEYTEGFIQLESLLRREKQRALRASQHQPYISSCCGGMTSHEYDDLYATERLPLELEIYLHQVLLPHQFQREVWEMSLQEKWNEVPILKCQADQYVQKREYNEAQKRYQRCKALLENLQFMNITPSDPQEGTLAPAPLTQEELKKQLLQCQLNTTLCNLKLENYPLVIVECTEILKQNPMQIKALYRRALAYIRIGRDLEEAEADLIKILKTGAMQKEDPEFSKVWNELKQKLTTAKEKEKKIFKNVFPAY